MATVYKRGKIWYLQWSDGHGQHRLSLKKFGVSTEHEAKNYKLAKELEIGTGEKIISSAPRFEDYSSEYLEWYKHEFPASYDRTESIIRTTLIPEFGNMPINIIEPGSVEFWKSRRLLKASRGTVAKELRCFKAMIKRAVEWEIISRHPFPYVKAPKDISSKPPSFYSKAEMQALYNLNSPYRWHWQLFANTGLRRSEALNLKRTQVFEDRIRVLSEEGARTKSGKWREIPLNKAAQQAVSRLLEASQSNDYVFPRVTPFSLTRAFDRDRRAAGLEGNLHWLRHTFVSHLVMAGLNLRKVQLLAGHANYSTTERYAHLSPESLQDLAGVEI